MYIRHCTEPYRSKGNTMLTAGSAWALVFFLAAIGTVIGCGYALFRNRKDKYHETFGLTVATVIGAVVAIGISIGTFPWAFQYHVMELHTGKVVRVEQRLITDDSSKANLTKEIAFWMEGEPRAYITEDVRLTGLKPGQTLTVNQHIKWNYGGEDSIDIIYVSAPVG